MITGRLYWLGIVRGVFVGLSLGFGLSRTDEGLWPVALAVAFIGVVMYPSSKSEGE